MKNKEEFTLEELVEFGDKLLDYCMKEKPKVSVAIGGMLLQVECMKNIFNISQKEFDELNRFIRKIVKDGFENEIRSRISDSRK